MKHYTYSNKYFHEDLFLNENCIIDNEIANDISSDWDYKKGIPVVVGFLHKDKMDIYLAESEDDKEFRDAVHHHISTALTETELYSFNRHMEKGNFKGAWDIDVEINEIKPFKGKGWSKDRCYLELVASEQIPDCKIADVFSGDAGECIRHWDKFQDTGKIEYAMKIIQHNINCLLKESVIQKNKPFFLNNFNIDEKGWVVE